MNSMVIETTTRIWREGTQYIAHAMPLDVSSAGATPDGARKALREAVDLFISTAKEHGTLDEVLEECGYTFAGGTWSAPQIVAQQDDKLAV